MSTYSSAMFNFVPELALDFFNDVHADNASGVTYKMKHFVLPYLDIRHRGHGYGVSIVKAGLRSVGRDVGPVRPPLKGLTAHEKQTLGALVKSIARIS